MVELPRLRDAGLRVVHECMHGSGYGYVAELLGGGRTTVTQLHSDRNPFFGGLNPEPIPPNIDDAIAVMKGGGHDLCILTDGDADRVGIIDETGRFINQLQVFALLVLHLFDVLGMRGPIVKTVNMTAMVEQLAKQFNTEVYEVQVGFKYVAPKMMETNAVIGGEESGGFGVRGHIPERDGILIGMLFADMIVRRGRCRRSFATSSSASGPTHTRAMTSTCSARRTTETASASPSSWRTTSRRRSRASKSRACARTTASSSTSRMAAGCCSEPAAPKLLCASTPRRLMRLRSRRGLRPSRRSSG